jgi:hypothetical protein
MNCCDYGCNQSKDCPARESGQAKGRHIESQPLVCAGRAIIPIEAPPNVWREFLKVTLFPCLVCMVLGASLMYLVLHFHPAP